MRPLAALLSALLLAHAGSVHAREAPGLAWIYVEANTGGSSGGHVALRVADSIYHVQQAPGGSYELNRDEWETFRHLYAGLQNRTLAIAELDVAAADVERVELRLARAYVSQREDRERVERLARDAAWLGAWRDGRTPPPLPGAGLLDPAAQPDPIAAALRDEVVRRLGVGFAGAALERVSEAIARVAPGDDLEALREALLLREALRGLDEAWGLAENALLPQAGVLAEPLSDAERSAVRRFAEAQQEAVLALLASRRPDRARPLLLAIARHQAFARSAASGRLVLLDPYAGLDDDAPEREPGSPATWSKLARELSLVLREGRPKVLGAAGFDEAQWNLLELAAGVWREFERGAAGGSVRRLPRRSAPAAARVVAFTPEADGARLARAEADSRRALRDAEHALAERYRYGVVRHNCVTELVRLLNEAFPDQDRPRALGAALEPGAGLGFIPFVSFDQVTSQLRVARIQSVPSHRERELARLLAEDAGLPRRLGESTTVLSSIYEPRSRDGSFLFFTDDVLWRRPLLGLANLGWAAGSGVVGLATAPFDGGRRLRAAGSGIWYSLPELVFANIRKGTFEWVPADESGPGGAQSRSGAPSGKNAR